MDDNPKTLGPIPLGGDLDTNPFDQFDEEENPVQEPGFSLPIKGREDLHVGFTPEPEREANPFDRFDVPEPEEEARPSDETGKLEREAEESGIMDAIRQSAGVALGPVGSLFGQNASTAFDAINTLGRLDEGEKVEAAKSEKESADYWSAFWSKYAPEVDGLTDKWFTSSGNTALDMLGLPGKAISYPGALAASHIAESERQSAEKRVAHADKMLQGDAKLPQKNALRAAIENTIQSVGTSVSSIPKFAGEMGGYAGRDVMGLDTSPDQNWLKDIGVSIERQAKDKFPGDEARQHQYAQKIAHGFGSMLSFYGSAGLGALAKLGAKGQARLIVLMGASMEGANEFDQATQAMKTKTDVTEMDRFFATMIAAAAGTTEALPISRALTRARGGQSIIRNAAGEAGEEGLQEGFQTTVTNIGAGLTYDPDRRVTEGVLDGVMIGVLLGGTMGGASSATVKLVNGVSGKPESRVLETPEPILSSPEALKAVAEKAGVSEAEAREGLEQIASAEPEARKNLSQAAMEAHKAEPAPTAPEQGVSPAQQAETGAEDNIQAFAIKKSVTSGKSSANVSFPDDPHARLYDLGRRYATGEAVTAGEQQDMFNIFKGYALEEEANDIRFDGPEDVRELAEEYYSATTEEVAHNDEGDVEAGDMLADNETRVKWYKSLGEKYSRDETTLAPDMEGIDRPKASAVQQEREQLQVSVDADKLRLEEIREEIEEAAPAERKQVASIYAVERAETAKRINDSNKQIAELEQKIADEEAVRNENVNVSMDQAETAETQDDFELPKGTLAEMIKRERETGATKKIIDSHTPTEQPATDRNSSAGPSKAKPPRDHDHRAPIISQGGTLSQDAAIEIAGKTLANEETIAAIRKLDGGVEIVTALERIASGEGAKAGPRTIVDPTGEMEVNALPEIVELSELKQAEGQLQPRDRSRKESEFLVRERARNLDPEQLRPSRVSDTGAPIITEDGTILSGNGRSLTLQEVYGSDNLADNQKAYRVAINAPEGMKQPVLVMRITDNLSLKEQQKFADLSNRSRIAGLSATERARRDAEAAGPETMALYTGGDFTSPDNRRFYEGFKKKVVASSEQNQFAANGVLTREGADRMNAAVLAAAYDNDKGLMRMLESTDDNVKAITNALRNVAGRFAGLKEKIKVGAVRNDMDITPQLVEMAALISNWRDKGIKPREGLAQQDAFDKIDPLTEQLTRAVYNDQLTRAKSQAKITAILNTYLDEAEQKSAGEALFSDQTSVEDVINYAREKLSDAGYPDIFTAGEETARGRDGESGQQVPGSENDPLGRAVAERGRSKPSRRARRAEKEEQARQKEARREISEARLKNRKDALVKTGQDLGLIRDEQDAKRLRSQRLDDIEAELNRRNEGSGESSSLVEAVGDVDVRPQFFDLIEGIGAFSNSKLSFNNTGAITTALQKQGVMVTQNQVAALISDAIQSGHLRTQKRKGKELVMRVPVKQRPPRPDFETSEQQASTALVAHRNRIVDTIEKTAEQKATDLITARRESGEISLPEGPVTVEEFDDAVKKLNEKYGDKDAPSRFAAEFEGQEVKFQGGEGKITQTPEFKRWFGDSKVVDEAGEPLVVYHGTDAEFDAFKIMNNDLGVHIGTREAANKRLSQITGEAKKSIPLYAKIENPLRLGDVLWAFPDSVVTVLLSRNIVDRPYYDKFMKRTKAGASETELATMNRQELQRLGYDGVQYRNEFEDPNSYSYIVFSPTQIKSIYNQGTFDPEDPRIMFQSGDLAIPANADISTLYPADEITRITHMRKAFEDILAVGERLMDVDWKTLEAEKAADHLETIETFSQTIEAQLQDGYEAIELLDEYRDAMVDLYGDISGQFDDIVYRIEDVLEETGGRIDELIEERFSEDEHPDLYNEEGEFIPFVRLEERIPDITDDMRSKRIDKIFNKYLPVPSEDAPLQQMSTVLQGALKRMEPRLQEAETYAQTIADLDLSGFDADQLSALSHEVDQRHDDLLTIKFIADRQSENSENKAELIDEKINAHLEEVIDPLVDRMEAVQEQIDAHLKEFYIETIKAEHFARMKGGDVKFQIKASHYSPHDFDPAVQSPAGRFKMAKMGEGEGFQAYGKGMYFFTNESVGDYYKQSFSEKVVSPERIDAFVAKINKGPDEKEFIRAFAEHVRYVEGSISNTIRNAEIAGSDYYGFEEAVRNLIKKRFPEVVQMETRHKDIADRWLARGGELYSEWANNHRTTDAYDPNDIWELEAFRSKDPEYKRLDKLVEKSEKEVEATYNRYKLNIAKEFEGVNIDELLEGAKRYDVSLDVEPTDLLHYDVKLSEQPEKIQGILRERFPEKIVYTSDTVKVIYDSIDSDGIIVARNGSNEANDYAVGTIHKTDDGWSVTVYGNDELEGKIFDNVEKAKNALESVAKVGTEKYGNDLLFDIGEEALQEAGIPGLRFLDGKSRKDGEGSYNYVIWDTDKIKITHKNGGEVDHGARGGLLNRLKDVQEETRAKLEEGGVKHFYQASPYGAVAAGYDFTSGRGGRLRVMPLREALDTWTITPERAGLSADETSMIRYMEGKGAELRDISGIGKVLVGVGPSARMITSQSIIEQRHKATIVKINAIAKSMLGDRAQVDVTNKLPFGARGMAVADNLVRVALQTIDRSGKWVSNPDPVQTLGHETLHVLRDVLVDHPSWWNILSAEAKKQKLHKSRAVENSVEAYRQLAMSRGETISKKRLDEVREEEAVAELMGNWLSRTESVPARAKPVMARIRDFFARIREWFESGEFAVYDDILQRVRAGEFATEGRSSQQAVPLFQQVDKSTGRSMRRSLDELGYYSQALEAAKGLKQKKGTPQQFLSMLKKAGVKDGEIEATGLDKFLEGKKSVTKDEIVQHLEDNRVKLSEKTNRRISVDVTRLDIGSTSGETALNKILSNDFSEIARVRREKELSEIEAWATKNNSRFSADDFEAYGKTGDLEVTGVSTYLEEYAAIVASNGKVLMRDGGQIREFQSMDDAIDKIKRSVQRAQQRAIDNWTRSEDRDQTKWSDYSLDPSNPTYRETVLHLPSHTTKEDVELNKKVLELQRQLAGAAEDARQTGDYGMVEVLEQQLEEHQERLQNISPFGAYQRDPNKFSPEDFQSGHFEEPNIIGHMMTSMTSHEGKPVYTIDQIQSDWGQTARDQRQADEGANASRISSLKAQIETLQNERYEKIASLDEYKELVELSRPYKAYGFSESDVDYNSVESVLNHGSYMQSMMAEEDVPRKVSDKVSKLLNIIDQTEPRTSEHDRLTAELIGLEVGDGMDGEPVATHPLVNTTDQWVNTTLRRAIRQAVEANADYIAIPHGDTVLSYNPGGESGMRTFYNQIVPKNLRKLLGRMDKKSSKPTRVKELTTPTDTRGYRDDTGNEFDPDQTGFTLFELTPLIKAKVMNEGQPMFQFGGVNAKTADKKALERAEAMEQEGRNRDDIWYDTGWFRGVDGKWRFEIDDSGAHWNPEIEQNGLTPGSALDGFKTGFGRNAKAEDMVLHENLYGNYHQIGGTMMLPLRDSLANRGELKDDRSSMRLNTRYPGEDMLSTSLHEYQHIVQGIEEFAIGGSPSLFYPDKVAADEMIGTVNQNLTDISKIMDSAKKAGDDAEYKVQKARYDKLMEYKLNDLVPRAIADPVDQYRRLAGEVEARTVQKRMDMTAEQRRSRAPWLDYDVPEGEQIVHYGAGEMMSVGGDPVTSTPEFKAWFGDSKVVDEAGEPLVVYHGTDEDIEAFSLGRDGFGSGLSTGAVWFSDAYGSAQDFGETVMPTYLAVSNPLIVNDPNMWTRENIPNLVSEAKKKGHDGLIAYNVKDGAYTSNLFAAFDPTQIKSIYNQGSFDPADPRILFQMPEQGMSVEERAKAEEHLKQEIYASGILGEDGRSLSFSLFDVFGMEGPDKSKIATQYRMRENGSEEQSFFIPWSELPDGAVEVIAEQTGFNPDNVTWFMRPHLGIRLSAPGKAVVDIWSFDQAVNSAAVSLWGEQGLDHIQTQIVAGMPELSGQPELPADPDPALVNVKSLVEISDRLYRALGVPVVSGRLDPVRVRMARAAGGDLRGYYNTETDVVRIKALQDFDTRKHEVGHAIAARLGEAYNDFTVRLGDQMARYIGPEMAVDEDATPAFLASEGFAEFIRLYVTNPAIAQSTSKTFHGEFERVMEASQPEIYGLLKQAQGDFADNINAPADARLAASIKSGLKPHIWERIGAALKEDGTVDSLLTPVHMWLRKLYSDTTDRMHLFHNIVTQAVRTAESNDRDIRLDAYLNPRVSMAKLGEGPNIAFTDMAYGVGHVGVDRRGKYSMFAVLKTAYGGPRFPGMAIEELRQAVGAYLVARKARWLWRRWQLDPAQFLGEHRGEPTGNSLPVLENGFYYRDTVRNENRVWINGKWERALDHAPDSFSLAGHEKTIADLEARYPHLPQVAEQVSGYLKDLALKMKQGDLIDEQTYQEYLLSSDYVPTFRDMSDQYDNFAQIGGRNMNGHKAFKQHMLRGSYRDYIDPIENIARLTIEVNTAILNNRPKKQLAALLARVGPGSGHIGENVPAKQLVGKDVHVMSVLKQAMRQNGVAKEDADQFAGIMKQLVGDNARVTQFSQQDAKEGRDDLLWYLDQGELRALQLIDPQLAKPVIAMFDMAAGSEDTSSALEKVMGSLTRIPHSGITKHPLFHVFNIIRDNWDSAVRVPGFIPIISQIKTISENKKLRKQGKDTWDIAMASHGGIMSGLDRFAMQSIRNRDYVNMRKGVGWYAPTSGKFYTKTMPELWHYAWKWTDFSEGLTRQTIGRIESTRELRKIKKRYERNKESMIAEYQRVYSDLKTAHPQFTEDHLKWMAKEFAASKSRNYVDYGRRGQSGIARFMQRYGLMFNAGLQGIDRELKTIIFAETESGEFATPAALANIIKPWFDPEYQKKDLTPMQAEAMRRAGYGLMVMTMIGLVQNMLEMGLDDERDRMADSDIERAMYFHVNIGGERWRIPRGFGLMNLTSNMIRATLESTYYQDPTAWQRFRKTIWSPLLPSMSLPIMEMWLALGYDQRSFPTHRALTPDYEKGRSAENQYNEYTPKAAIGIGDLIAASPRKVEQVINLIFTRYSRDIMFVGEAASSDRPRPRWVDYPIINGLVRPDSRWGGRYTQAFWDKIGQEGKFTAAHKDYKQWIDTGRGDEVGSYLANLDEDSRAWAILNQNYDASIKRLHPFYRAQNVFTVMSDVQKQLNVNLMEDKNPYTKKTSRMDSDLSRGDRREAFDILDQIKKREVANALMVMGVPGMVLGGTPLDKALFPTKPYYDELKAKYPSVYKIMDQQMKSQNGPTIYRFSIVKDRWGDVRKTLLSPSTMARIKANKGEVRIMDSLTGIAAGAAGASWSGHGWQADTE